MSSFQKLFVNSTNRFSAVKNIILSQGCSSFTPLQISEYQNQNFKQINTVRERSCYQQEITETYQELQHRYQELSKVIKQANHEKQIMSMLFDKIYKIQQGQDESLKKRFRRKKNEIQAKHQCKILSCNKIYSSSTSLARHAKLKHAYSMFQPPQHNYQIPPQPNLTQSSQISKRDETQSNLKSLAEDEDEDPDANEFQDVESSQSLPKKQLLHAQFDNAEQQIQDSS